MLFLIREPANARQREILVDAVADKETYTRQEAAKLVKKMKLAPENYMQLENMLKYKKSDIRETVLSILYQMDEEKLDGLIGRLLTDAKEEKRTAGLDLLLQLKKDENRQRTFAKCVAQIDYMAQTVANISTKEQILIREIRNTHAEQADAEEGYGGIRFFVSGSMQGCIPALFSGERDCDRKCREECRCIGEAQSEIYFREEGRTGYGRHPSCASGTGRTV